LLLSKEGKKEGKKEGERGEETCPAGEGQPPQQPVQRVKQNTFLYKERTCLGI